MDFDLDSFETSKNIPLIKEYLDKKELTPCVFIDLELIKNRYVSLKENMPYADIYYAIKSNPNKHILELLRDLGSYFDIASIYELDLILSLGVSPDRLSYGNTIKKKSDIKYFYDKGVRLFVTDSLQDLQNISSLAPGSHVFFRIMTDGKGADWPLSKKFGSHPDVIYDLVGRSVKMNLIPYGLSFHSGSQQRDIGQWDDNIAKCKYLFDSLKKDKGIELKMINIGGGFPAKYTEPTLPMDNYYNEIKRFLDEDFSESLPRILVEPGRSLVGDSGIMATKVILISKKSRNALNKWVYFDVGKFNGLAETMNESIKYPIYFEKDGEEEEVILAGPTCDSVDILYENYKYFMPSSTQPGDYAFIFTTGAYTYTYSSVCFNGFPPLNVRIIKDGKIIEE